MIKLCSETTLLSSWNECHVLASFKHPIFCIFPRMNLSNLTNVWEGNLIWKFPNLHKSIILYWIDFIRGNYKILSAQGGHHSLTAKIINDMFELTYSKNIVFADQVDTTIFRVT